MNIQRRYTKREILGQLRVEYLFSIQHLPGITSTSDRWEVLGAFLKAGEGRAERLVETDGGFVFLQSIPHRPNTGAIYVYNEASGSFLWMRFDRDDDLNGVDFDHAVWAYKLLRWADLSEIAAKTNAVKTDAAKTGSSHKRRKPARQGAHPSGLHLVS